MATFFGEVVFPVSRAFWDEEDENRTIDYSVNQFKLSIQWLKEKPLAIDTLIIVEGEMLIDFFKRMFVSKF
uniref:Proteasome assembly chaperone 1 n=1 Tax=Apis cerana TaxID=7461 RepID=V9IL95_APICE